MMLKEILQKLVDAEPPVLLQDDRGAWEASDLLNALPQNALRVRAHLQTGLYIAEIDDGGYLGRVLYRIKRKE